MTLYDSDATQEYLLDGRYVIKPLVRCKDCKHWETIVKNGAEYGMCVAWEGLLHVTEKEGFCYKAERKEE